MNENKLIIENMRKWRKRETTKTTIILIRMKSGAKARPQLPEIHSRNIYNENIVRSFSYSKIDMVLSIESSFDSVVFIFTNNLEKQEFYDLFGKLRTRKKNEPNSPNILISCVE